MTSFILLRPLWLLAIIPLFIAAWFMRKRQQNQGWNSLLVPDIAQFLLQEQSHKTKQNSLFLPLAMTWILTAIALAGPSFSYTQRPVASLALAKVIVLDMSLSMRATDLKPNRLTQMRFKMTDLLENNKEGEVALVAYAGDAFVLSPLTTDTNTILNLLPTLSPEIMPSKGSNPVAGITQAVTLLKNSGYQQGQILLVTDGINEAQSDEIKKLLTETNHSFSILAIGTKQGAPIKLKNGNLLKDNLGTIVIPQVNSDRLSRLAKQLHGQYQLLNHGSQSLNDLFTTQINMNNTHATELKTIQRNDDGIWFVPLIALMVALSFRKQLFFTLLLPLIILQSNDGYAAEPAIPKPVKKTTSIWNNRDQNAAILFDQQDYQAAADHFDDKNWQASALYNAGQYQQAADIWAQQQGADASYNLGNAYAKLEDFDKAEAAYKRSLKLNPDNKDAQANLALLEQLKKQNPDKKQQGQPSKDGEQQKNNDQDGQQGNQPDSDKSNTDNSAPKKEQQSDESQSKSQDNDQTQSGEKQQSQNSEQSEKKSENKETQGKQDQEQEQAANSENDDTQQGESAQSNLGSNELLDTEEQKRLKQWLKQIPDDPSLLLKNKMKLESIQRGNTADSEQVW